jgi:hypothetical protein
MHMHAWCPNPEDDFMHHAHSAITSIYTSDNREESAGEEEITH